MHNQSLLKAPTRVARTETPVQERPGMTDCMRKLENTRLAIAGFDHVGLPFAVFDTYCDTPGFDINRPRIDDLHADHDQTLEVDAASHLRFSAVLDDLHMCKTRIATAPTPISQARRPDPTTPANAGQRNGTKRRSVQSMNSCRGEADMFSSAWRELELE